MDTKEAKAKADAQAAQSREAAALRIAKGRELIATKRAQWDTRREQMRSESLARIEANDRVQKLQLDHAEALLRIQELEAEVAELRAANG